MADSVSDLLNDMGIEYRYVAAFPVEEIVRNNVEGQVRMASHIAPSKTVASYANQMKEGAVFPPVVLCKRTKEVGDGNTRLAAVIKNGETTIPAYVADFSDLSVRMFFAGRANQQGGLRLDAIEAKNLAVSLLKEGTDPSQISLGLGVSVDEAQKWAHELAAIERLAKAGMDESRIYKLKSSVLSRLNSIKLDSVLLEQANLVLDAALSTDQNSKLVTILNRTRSEEEALRLIAVWRKEYGSSIKKQKAGIGNKRPGAIACISLAHANLMKRTTKEYEIEINGGASPEVIAQIKEINERSVLLLDILTRS